MNKLYPIQNSLYSGPLPKPSEFSSITGFFRSEWFCDYVELYHKDEIKILHHKNHEIILIADDGQVYQVGRLESLEHIPEEMLMPIEEYAGIIRKLEEQAKAKIDARNKLASEKTILFIQETNFKANAQSNIDLVNQVMRVFNDEDELSTELANFIQTLRELVTAQQILLRTVK